MSAVSHRYDVVVIGSGMSGLAVAALLAQSGRKVLVCEQHYRYGGYLQQFPLHRTLFDAGCHYVGALGQGQVFDRYLRALGVREQLTAHALDPDGFDVVDYGSGSIAIPAGHARVVDRLSARFPHQARAVASFIAELQAEVARFPMYSMAAAEHLAGQTPNPSRTLSDVLSACGVTDSDLRTVLCAHNLLYFVEPHECPFTLHAFVTDSFIQGAYTIRGGGHAVVKALLARFRGHGGVARRRCRVTAIHVSDRRVRGIETDAGDVIEAPVVIGAIDPKAVLRLLPQQALSPAGRRRIERLRPGVGGLAAYLRVDADLSRYARRNYLLAGAHPRVFVTTPSAREPGWRGPATVIAFGPSDARQWDAWGASLTDQPPDEYTAAKETAGQAMLAPVRALMPELSKTVTCDFGTPLTHRDYTGNTDGAIYGIHHSVDQTGMRGITWRTRIQGLLLSGHSVLYPGLLGATISAFYTAGELLGLDTLHKRLRDAV